ncbi:hypothetical protein JOJ86_002931 [Rhodococcus percolatus]|uniref:hypothetical protein n=1 Tax=Rhodococcus opacus TaxID=37919 RepID=UPI0015FDD11D|nr:hypothetical protein [Rhodococcus opacus]MBA8959639.1 hypothetical protein [Rhodococcus opacus]MBP2205205.1 hypothetical protein [Rhodococcus opacus]
MTGANECPSQPRTRARHQIRPARRLDQRAHGPPGTDGQNAATGNGYAREQTNWGTASNGTITGSEVEIDAGPGQYVSAGLWTAQTGGTFIDTVAVVNTTLGAVGKLKVTPTYTQS